MNRSKPTIKRLFLATLSILILGSVVLAESTSQPPLINSDEEKTLDDLIQLALDHEYNYRKAVEGERIVGILRMSAIGQFLPSITVNGTWANTTLKNATIYDNFLNPIGKEDTDNSSSSTSLSFSETLFNGGQRWYAYKSAKYQLANIFLSTERSRHILIAQVKTVYYNHLIAGENLRVQNEILEQRREALRLAQARYAAGDVIELDVMQAEIDWGNQENYVLQAQQGLENAREALNLTVGIHLDSKFPVAGELTPVLPAANAEQLVLIALRERPDYRAARNQVKINSATVKQWNSGYLPRITASYTIGRGGSVRGSAYDFQFPPDDASSTMAFSVNWTIFDRFQREYNRQTAVVTQRQSVFDESMMRQNVMVEIRSEWRNLENLFQQIQVSERNRELARRQLTLEQERYRVGASSQLNLRSAQVTFITAENDYLIKVMNFFTTLATLERDLGASFEEVSR